MGRVTDAQFRSLCDASQERSKTLDDLFRTNGFITVADDALEWDAKAVKKVLQGAAPSGQDHLKALNKILSQCDDWSVQGLEAAIKPYVDIEAGGNLGVIAQPLRVALCGGTVSPPIFDTLAILGKASSIKRIDRCVAAHT